MLNLSPHPWSTPLANFQPHVPLFPAPVIALVGMSVVGKEEVWPAVELMGSCRRSESVLLTTSLSPSPWLTTYTKLDLQNTKMHENVNFFKIPGMLHRKLD